MTTQLLTEIINFWAHCMCLLLPDSKLGIRQHCHQNLPAACSSTVLQQYAEQEKTIQKPQGNVKGL
jgi:hypothetical protein